MIESLTNFLSTGYFITDNKSTNSIEVRERLEGIVNQDIIFVLACNELKYELFKLSRGTKTKIMTLHDKEIAIFYFGIMIKMSRFKTLCPRPEIKNTISNEIEAKNCLSRFLDSNLFEIENYKKDAICLINEKNTYVVGYCDIDMIFHTISNDNSSLTMGAKVLANFTWKYMYFKQMIKEYDIELDQNQVDYKAILRNLLNLKN
ncbi:hypothetical protein BWG86_14640 [Listeria monocytogenes]|nr:hypothetical protein [Listeria monocytogenes]